MRPSALIAALLFGLPAPAAAIQLTSQGCDALAGWSFDVVWARQVGADKEKVRASLVELADRDRRGIMRLLLRDFEMLWATNAAPEIVLQIVQLDCHQRRGKYGEGT